jgi:hypothetical protein
VLVRVKYWEIISKNLRNAGWNCGCMTTTDGKGRAIWVVAAERSTPDALLCMPMTCPLHFWNYKPRFIVNSKSDEVLGNHR